MLKKVKLEKAGIAEDLEDAEELSKCLHLSEDKKMSEIIPRRAQGKAREGFGGERGVKERSLSNSVLK